MNNDTDARFINGLSELLFGYREASNDEIRDRIIQLQVHESEVQLSRTAKAKAKKLRRIARELSELVEGANG